MTTPSPGPAYPRVSPKVSWPTALLAVAGVGLLVLDKVGVIDVDDTLWVALLGSSGGVGVVGYGVDDPADHR
jgi:hypothetical protein